MTIISDFLSAINGFFSSEGVFLLCLALMLIGFVVNLILTLVALNYTRKDRRWYYFTIPTVLCFQIAQSLNAGENGALIFLSLSFACLFFYFSWSIKSLEEKNSEQKKTVSEFCKKISLEAENRLCSSDKSDNDEQQKAQENIVREGTGESEVQKISPKKEEFVERVNDDEGEKFDLDFSHVKNVMARLDYFSLSPADKRQVKELEITLREAECGEYSKAIKERLNDGLGILLKIMSKYGV